MKRLVLAATILAGCGGGARSAPQQATVPDAPLNSFASLPLIVLPTQGLRSGDAMGWAAKVGERRAFLASIDSALERSFLHVVQRFASTARA